MFRLAFLALCVLQSGVADAEPPKKGASGLVPQAAKRLLDAWRDGDPSFGDLARARSPDPFQVSVALAIRSEDTASRQAVLEAVAQALGTDKGRADWARRWSVATDEQVSAERKRLETLGELRAAQRSAKPKDVPALLSKAKKLAQDPTAPSIATPLAQLYVIEALVAMRRGAEAIEFAASIAPQVEALRWVSLSMRIEAQRASAFRQIGRRAEAAEAYRQMAHYAREMGSEEQERVGLRYALVLLSNLGHMAQRYALGLRLNELAAERAVPTAGRLGTEIWLIDCEVRLGLLARAASRAERVAREALQAGATDVARQARILLLGVYSGQGRFPDALVLANEIRNDPEFASDTQHYAREVVGIAALYRDVGRLDEALALCESALANIESERKAALTASSAVLGLTASLLRQAGRREEGLALYERAAAQFRALQHHRLASVLGALIECDLEDGNLDRARERIAEVQRISANLTSRRKARGLELLGRIELAAKNPREALAAFEAALEAVRDVEPAPVPDAYLLANRGRAQQQLGAHDKALASLRASTELFVNIATGLGELHGLGLRRRAHRVASVGFHSAIALSETDAERATEHLAHAWWFREAGHALLLAESIRNSDAAVRERLSPQDRADEEAALKALTLAQTRAVASERTPAARAQATRSLQVAHDAYRSISLHVDTVSRAGGAWTRGRPVPLADFQASLAADRAALAYFDVDGRLYGMCVRRTTVCAEDLGDTESIRRSVSAWRDLASAPGGPATRSGAKLYDRLIRPFESHMRGAHALLVLPDGALAYLPFGALVRDRDADGNATAYVLDQHAISYVPSGAVRHALQQAVAKRPVGRGLLALGDPAYGAPSDAKSAPHALLAGTRAEVIQIAALYPEAHSRVLLGTDATVGAWHAALDAAKHPTWRAVHLACHGLVDPERPRLSGLVFAGGNVLSLEQIHRRPIPADLVVLSACETASGTFRRGEGVMGLARGFFQVGAPRVVVTTWPVSDLATGGLMTAFHRAWKQGDVSAAQALRASRLALRRSKGPLAHPYYWAPFVLWGP